MIATKELSRYIATKEKFSYATVAWHRLIYRYCCRNIFCRNGYKPPYGVSRAFAVLGGYHLRSQAFPSLCQTGLRKVMP